MHRRIFLRGLGGACVAAPFLSSIATRSGNAQTAAAARRLIVMFTHYGCVTPQFFPLNSNGPLTADDLQPTTLKTLVPFVGKVLMPRGIRAMNQWTSNMTLGQGNDTFLQACASYFTCQPVTPNSNNPFSFDASVKNQAEPVGPSLDHVIAQQLTVAGTPFFMRVGNVGDTQQTGISYAAAETPYPGFGTPTQAFSILTGLFQTGAPTSPDTYRAARGQSVIDIVRDDLDTLERFDMSQADKHKLEAWKALLDQTGTMITSAQCSSDSAASLGLTQANIDAASAGGLGDDILATKIGDGGLDGADIYSNVAVLAAVCNANPVIVLKYPPNWVFKALGLTTESHSLWTRLQNLGEGQCTYDQVAAALADLVKIDTYHATKFAYLVSQLGSIDEGDGTVLDNSAAVWFQEVSDGVARNSNNLPIVQVGSMGGYFKTGWAVNVDDGSATLTPGTSQACVDPSGQPQNGGPLPPGTDEKLANAPINKYFCNLMNGLGVRAGDDGFASKTGTAPVTKFGMYDRTQDFIGGGTNPPMIHDPGEFSELRSDS
jgi:hypothetical protein